MAALYAPLGLGTDTGGSIRLPASATGIVGLRPTESLWSRDGIVPLSTTFDMAGPMARNVSDVAVTLGLLAAVQLMEVRRGDADDGRAPRELGVAHGAAG